MMKKLGYALVNEAFIVAPTHLTNYLDHEAVGRDYRLNTGGEFIDKYFIEFL